MLDGINSQAAGYAANQPHEQTDRLGSVTPNSEHEEKVADVRQVRTLPGQEQVGPDGRKRDSFELSREAEDIRQLQMRDQEVRTHEAAHAAAGGAYAGSPSYTFERGPDGQSYAVGGEVSIDLSPISGDPVATLQKAQQVRAAALAPAEPSGQDMKVAQRAQTMAAEARVDLANVKAEELKETDQESSALGSTEEPEGEISAISKPENSEPIASVSNSSPGFARLSIHA